MKNHFFPLFSSLFIVFVLHAQDDAREFEALRNAEAQRYQSLLRYLDKASVAKPTVNVKYYRLNIRIADQKNYVRGDITTISIVLEQTLNEVSYDLLNALTVDSAFVDNAKVSSTATTNTISLSLPRTYHAGDTLTTQVYYHGSPPRTGLGSYTDSTRTDGSRWIFTLSEPYGARDWWPCIDHPGDKADSVDIWITCSQNYLAVTNGRLAQTLQNGDGTKTCKWKHRYPIATYLVSVTIGNFNSFSDWYKYTPADSMEVVNYVLPNIATTSPTYRANTALTPRMLQIFSALFGAYPFLKEKYGHAQFGWGGGMEHQTLTSLGSSSFIEATIAHELVHQWFGDMITCRTWPDLWLNEGFAQYFECVYREKQYGMSSYWSRISSRLSSAKNATGTLYVQDSANVNNLFASSRVYNKGASVLHMLRHVLGDSIFFASIKSYASDPKLMYGTASTSDFRAACEITSGRDLGWFFNEWVFGERYPKYSYSYSIAPEAGEFRLTVRIQQTTGTTNPTYFTMPVDLKFQATGWDSTVTVLNNAADQTFQIHLSHKPDTVQFDPEVWILRDVTKLSSVVGDGQVPQRFELLQNYPNPFNPSTTIRFNIQSRSLVRLCIYDILGRLAKEISNGEMEAGQYQETWDADLPSGLYFYRLEAVPISNPLKRFVGVKKMIVVK